MKALTIFLIVLICPQFIRAQHPADYLQEYISRVRAGQSPPGPIVTLPTENPQAIFSQLEAHLKDTLPTVRAAAAEIVHFVSINASDPSVRMLGVDLLLKTYRAEDAGHNSSRLNYLQAYRRDDFSSSARDVVRGLVRLEPAYFDRILRLAGFLQLGDLTADIRAWTQPGNPAAIRWSALLSLCRMGDAAATEAVLRRASDIPVNDDVVYQLFPDLIYTRAPKLIAYIVEALHQDQPNCFAADAEREVLIDCGYRIMEQLAPVVRDFPVELDEGGDLKSDNYQASLESIRLWFRENPGYTILDKTW